LDGGKTAEIVLSKAQRDNVRSSEPLGFVFSQSSLTWLLVFLRLTEATLINTFSQWQRFTFLAALGFGKVYSAAL
jgi:hypothetical protein